MRSECYCSWVCLFVCLFSVCLCVRRQQLTSGASICPENNTTYSTGNQSQNICFVKPHRCADTPLPALYGYPYSQPFLLIAIRMRILYVECTMYGEGLHFSAFHCNVTTVP